MEEKDYYKILGISPDASEKVIKQAYHKLAREFHPDKAANDEEFAKYEEDFTLVSKAYNTLKDKEKKAEYDQQLLKQKSSPTANEPPKQFLKTKTTTSSTEQKETTKSNTAANSQANTKRKAEVADRAFKKGMVLFKNKSYNESLEFIQAAINYNDEVAVYHVRLAQALMKSRKGINKAIESCKRAIELDPWNIEYKFILGEIYEEAGIISLAENTYRDILKWDATYTKAQEKLSILKSKGKAGESFFLNLWKKLTAKK